MEAISATAIVEEDWAAEQADHSRSTLRRTFQRVADALHRFIYIRVGGDSALAEDILQEVCCAAAESKTIPPDEDERGRWLFGIGRNLIRGHLRRLKRRGIHLPFDDANVSRRLADDMGSRPLPEEVLADRQRIDQLLLAITSLDAADQALIFSFYFDGQSSVELAEASGVSLKSIESKLYRVRHRLRARLDA